MEEKLVEHYRGYRVAFWNGNTASGRSAADRAVLEGLGLDRYSYSFEYRLPAQQLDLERQMAALDRVFQLGRMDKANEIRHVLGVVDPR
jgi:hypothetical protein